MMQRLIPVLAAICVAGLAMPGAVRAQSHPGAVESDRDAVEADKAAGASTDFQLSNTFSCDPTCMNIFYKVPKEKTLNLTSFSCYTASATIYTFGFASTSSSKRSGVTVVTPTSNGSDIFSGSGFAPLRVKGGEQLAYFDIGSAAHSAVCTVRGQLR